MYVTAERLAKLQPSDRANFAATTRLLSCLVTESLLQAIYIPSYGFTGVTGFSVVLESRVSPANAFPSHPYHSTDILAIAPLCGRPIFKPDGVDGSGKEIGILDPLDMVPPVFQFSRDEQPNDGGEHATLRDVITTVLSTAGWAMDPSVRLVPCASPLSIWRRFATRIEIESAAASEIPNELSSSIKWQQYSYENPPLAPSFASPSIEWEQSLVEGHPFHPMHKMRFVLPPIPDFAPGAYDLYRPKLRLIALPKEYLHVTYDFEKYIQPIVDAMSKDGSQPIFVKEGHIAIPVHELQLFHIRDKFKEALVYPEEFSLPSRAQASIRSLVVPNAYRDTSLKLAVGIKLTSATRTISPAAAYFSPRFSKNVVPFLALNPNIATVAKELASVVHVHPDGEVAKHCAAIVREAYELNSEERKERLIVCAALTEFGHRGEGGDTPSVVRVFGLDTEEKRLQWLSKYSRMLFDAFLPCMMQNGVGFELHPQNCVARFNITSKELLGFIVRDFGGMRVHRETVKASTGVDVDAPPGYPIIASDIDAVYTRVYHSLFHNHLQRLIRVLGLHYNGLGWEVVRGHLEDVIPQEHPLFAAWLSPERKTLDVKSLLKMKMTGMFRTVSQ